MPRAAIVTRKKHLPADLDSDAWILAINAGSPSIPIANVAETRVRHVHVVLDFATFARLKRKLGRAKGALSNKVRELILMDLGEKEEPSRV